MKKLCAFIGSIAFALGGCSSVTTKDYAEKTPKLDIRQYFNGNIEVVGIFYDMSGKADLEFIATIKASWKGNVGTLEEKFTYSDGKKDERVWTITMQDDENFTATAHDVIGTAIGTQHGNAANMKYVLNVLRSNGDRIKLNMDDWLYLVDDTTIINRTKMSKFGLQVGELVISMRKL